MVSYLIVRNRLSAPNIAPRTARVIRGYIVRNKDTFFVVIQRVWYILKQLFTSVSVKVEDIYLVASRLGKYPPLFTDTEVNNC